MRGDEFATRAAALIEARSRRERATVERMSGLYEEWYEDWGAAKKKRRRWVWALLGVVLLSLLAGFVGGCM